MRWALTRHCINSLQLQQVLQKHQKSIHAQSELWLSQSQARTKYRLRCRGGVTVTADAIGTRSVYSLSEYNAEERKALQTLQPLLRNCCSKWMILTLSDCGSRMWTVATPEQYGIASLFAPDKDVFDTALLVDAKVALPSSPSRTLSLFNAQETSNPFLVDDSLCHNHLFTEKPFSHTLSSSLSTLWSQHGYTSLKWLPASDMLKHTGLQALPGQTPHTVYELESVDFVHLCSLGDEKQKTILSSAPRWALLRSLTKSLIFSQGRWLTWRQLNLDKDLEVKRGEVAGKVRTKPKGSMLPKSFFSTQYNIWLRCDENISYNGVPQRRQILHKLLIYNSSQLAV